MRLRFIVFLAAGVWAAVRPASAGIQELALEGQWQRLLQVANRRAEQLPLQPREAFLAAYAARVIGDGAAQRRYLERALDDGDLSDLAAVELARLVVSSEPDRAAELAAPLLRSAASPQVRAAAVEVAVEAVVSGVDDRRRQLIQGKLRYLPRSQRRAIELALAEREQGPARRERLARLLETSTADLTALAAARLLRAEAEQTPRDRWLVAKSLYRHALYDEAVTILGGLAAAPSAKVPAWEVAFVAGRCAFRTGRWSEAIERYREALSLRRGAEGRADLAVHLARAHELAGDLEAAAEAARQAVVWRTTDDRRLFLARLRLRLDQPERALAGISRIRGRTARDRGRLMLGLYEYQRGDRPAARERLGTIRRRPWRGPASVLAAGLAADAGRWDEAINLVESHAAELSPFWAQRARELMARLPEQQLASWRERCASGLAAGDDRTRRSNLARWSTLETDARVLGKLRSEVASLTGLDGADFEPVFPAGLASELWQSGLYGEAVRWHSAGLPRADAREALWTARTFGRLGSPWLAIRTADAAWRLAGADLPVRGYPQPLLGALHPLPDSQLVWRSAVDSAVPWGLVAGVAREESRWDPSVVSRVGARGLMQLMPATAAATGLRLGRPVVDLDDLFDPAVSLRLGAAELSRLYGEFAGQLGPVVAAYNAGEAQAKLWLDQCGTPCPTEWYVANITFRATRRYSMDVLAAAEVYVELYGAAAPKQSSGE